MTTITDHTHIIILLSFSLTTHNNILLSYSLTTIASYLIYLTDPINIHLDIIIVLSFSLATHSNTYHPYIPIIYCFPHKQPFGLQIYFYNLYTPAVHSDCRNPTGRKNNKISLNTTICVNN